MIHILACMQKRIYAQPFEALFRKTFLERPEQHAGFTFTRLVGNVAGEVPHRSLPFEPFLRDPYIIHLNIALSMAVSLCFGGKSHVSNGQNVYFKEPCFSREAFSTRDRTWKAILRLPTSLSFVGVLGKSRSGYRPRKVLSKHNATQAFVKTGVEMKGLAPFSVLR